MDEMKLQPHSAPAIRSFRICVDHPHRPATLMGVIRRVAVERTGANWPRRQALALPRRSGAFA
jgi:hypothetical protein